MKVFAFVVLLGAMGATHAQAQTNSVRDTATAYGARLNAKGQPAGVNQRRVNSRIQTRIDNRLALRIERYRPASTNSPTSAYQSTITDKVRLAPIVAPPPQGDNDH